MVGVEGETAVGDRFKLEEALIVDGVGGRVE